MEIDITQEPGLILIAPEFSENLKRIPRYVRIPLDLMEYKLLSQAPQNYSFAFDFLYARIQSVPQITMNAAVIQNSIRSIFTASEAVSSNISPQER